MPSHTASAPPAVPASPVVRMTWLLGLINGDPDVLAAERLARFLVSGPLRVDGRTLVGIRAGAFDEAALVRALRRVLDGDGTQVKLPSLQFGVLRRGDRYLRTVRGQMQDIILYSVMELLTDPSAVALARCPAPAAGNWRLKCGRWFITSGARRGRRRQYCSEKCRQITHRKLEADSWRKGQ